MAKEIEASSESVERFAWWREAKFGMFIHWGLYALPAGVWKGREIAGIGEWIMRRAEIPVEEYEQLAKEFNPVKFNADAWVRVAKEAGMKYIVITSKHHDGFALYDSKVSEYDIMDATPFGRDPMAELAAACRKEGLRLCFYYSQAQDWHDPNAAGNDWDFNEEEKDFACYLEQKAKPQVREILTQYGPIGLIWFDTPVTITEEQSRELVDLVNELQPACLVNSRVGHDAGDYLSEGDNRIPVCVNERPWETPATLNDTWGFKTHDHNWKSPKILIRLLVDIVSKGGNYLLNVGPTAEGEIPQPSIDRLKAVGEWMKAHGEAVYGTKPSPFPAEFEWGALTRKPGRLYLHIFDWPGKELVLHGLQSKVKRASLLGGDGSDLLFQQITGSSPDHDILRLSLPGEAYDEHASVVSLEIDGEAVVDPMPIQSPNGRIQLEACQSHMHPAEKGSSFQIAGLEGNPSLPPNVAGSATGIVEGWVDAADWMSWRFKVVQPGAFDVELLTSSSRRNRWEGGHELTLELDGQSVPVTVTDDEEAPSPRSPHQKFVLTRGGQVSLSEPGAYTMNLKPQKIEAEQGIGLTLHSVNLAPHARP